MTNNADGLPASDVVVSRYYVNTNILDRQGNPFNER